MESNEKCLYCKEIIYPGLNFQNDCAKGLASNTNKASSEMPFKAKAKGEFAGYQTYSYSNYDSHGNYVGEKQGRYKSYYKSSDKIVDKSEILGLKNKSLRGPLCYDCMNKFLERVSKIFEGIKTRGRKKALEASQEKIRKKYMKMLQDWEKRI